MKIILKLFLQSFFSLLFFFVLIYNVQANSIKKIVVIYSYSINNQSELFLNSFIQKKLKLKKYLLLEYYLKSDIQKDFYFNKRFASELILTDLKKENFDLIILVGDESNYFVGIQHLFTGLSKIKKPIIVIDFFNQKYIDNNHILYFCNLNIEKIINFFQKLDFKIYLLYNNTLFSNGINRQLKSLKQYGIKINSISIKNVKDLKDFRNKINKEHTINIIINSLIYINDDIVGNLDNKQIAKYLYKNINHKNFIVNFFKWDFNYSSFVILCDFNDMVDLKIIPNYDDLSEKNYIIPEDLWKYLE